jgi:hypothetical protein
VPRETPSVSALFKGARFFGFVRLQQYIAATAAFTQRHCAQMFALQKNASKRKKDVDGPATIG